jgi:hypothetical protein
MVGGDHLETRHSPHPATRPGRCRWRAAQERRRRARLSARGRATLVALGGVPLLGMAAATLVPVRSEVASVDVAEGRATPPQPPPVVPGELLERPPVSRAALDLQAVVAPGVEAGPVGDSGVSGQIFERVPVDVPGISGPLRLEYTLDAELTRQVFRVLSQGRVKLGHVIVLEPAGGRVLAYASTDPEAFPATRPYPAASLVKVITAAAALDSRPETAKLPCRFSGSPYRLTPARVDPPSRGRTVSLRRALATSNNQCFAQLAVHAVGAGPLVDAITRFGWLSPPAPAHAAGSVEIDDDRYAVGKLGCGLAGCRITPLHAAQLAMTLAHGELVTPRWVNRVIDAEGRELLLPALTAPRRVISHQLAGQLREMLVDTTTRGTARSAFRRRNGRPLLGTVSVAGKTGSLSGKDPTGRYEWFIGVAPADEPRIAVAVLRPGASPARIRPAVTSGSSAWRRPTSLASPWPSCWCRASCGGATPPRSPPRSCGAPSAAVAAVGPRTPSAGGARPPPPRPWLGGRGGR